MDTSYTSSNIFETVDDQLPKSNWHRWLIGRPLATADAPHQTIGKVVGLAVFASDALSSVAYGPQEMMLILAMAGTAAFSFTLPLVFVIIGLLAILTVGMEHGYAATRDTAHQRALAATIATLATTVLVILAYIIGTRDAGMVPALLVP